MDTMIGIFPLIKLTVMFLMVMGVWFLLNKKWYKTATAIVVLIALIFNYVKIDGTNTKVAHKAEISKRTAEYKQVVSEAVIVHKKELSFEEKMALEAKRATDENQRIQDEIN